MMDHRITTGTEWGRQDAQSVLVTIAICEKSFFHVVKVFMLIVSTSLHT